MLQLGSTSFVIEGVQVFRDHQDGNTFWYLPGPASIARRDDGTPAFTLMVFKPAPGNAGTAGTPGGFLTFESVVTLDRQTEQAIIGRCRTLATDPSRDVVVNVVPFDSGTVECVALNVQGPGGTVAAPGSFRAIETILGASTPALFGDNRAIFSLALTKDGATIVQSALADGGAPVGVIYKLGFTALRPSLHVKITADLKAVYNEFGASLNAQIYWVKGGIEAMLRDLQQRGALKIEVTAMTTDTAEQEKWAMQFFADHLLHEWFEPKLGVDAVAKPPIADPLSPATSPGAGTATGTATTGSATHPVTPVVPRPSTPVPARPGAPVPAAPRPPTPTPTPGAAGPHPATPVAPHPATPVPAHPTSPVPATPVPSTPATPAPVGSTPVPGAAPQAATPAAPGAATPGAPHPGAAIPAAGSTGPTPAISVTIPATGSTPPVTISTPHGATPTSSTPAADKTKGAGLDTAIVSFKLRFIHQEELRQLTFTYDRTDAVQRTYAPQAFFGDLGADLQRPGHLIEIDLDNPFFREFTIGAVPTPADFTKLALQSSQLHVEYGSAADPGGPKRHDFVFDATNTSAQSWSTPMNKTLTTDYRYRVEYHFDPLSEWRAENTNYEFSGTSNDPNVELTPTNLLDFFDVTIATGDLDAQIVRSTDVELTFTDSTGWTTTDTMPVVPGSTDSTWRVRTAKGVAKGYGCRMRHTLIDGSTVVDSPEPQPRSARRLVVNDPFPDHLEIDLVPAWQPGVVGVIVELDYEDADHDYKWRRVVEFAGDDTATRHVRIGIHDPRKRTFTWRATFRIASGIATQRAPMSTDDPLVTISPI
jgi:hypothetical protein